MKQSIVLVSFVMASAVGLGALTACDDEEPFFKPCPLSESIIQLCEEESDDTSLTCVVSDHPMCNEHICAQWKGSDSFCSKVCSADTDCPTGSRCGQYLEFSFCVEEAVFTPVAQ